MPPLVRRLPHDRVHQDEALPGTTEVHAGASDETSAAMPQSATSPASTCAADRATFTACAHCINAGECKQLGCAYDELLVSIAARLEAIKAA
jgi:hypothetical protein